MATIIDFSAGLPRGADIKAAGHSGVIAYISGARAAWMRAKPLTRAAVDDYRAHGLQIAVVHQYGAGNARDSDVMRGYAGGKADALASDAKLRELGLGRLPVYFACDFDVTLAQYTSTVRPYFQGAADALGRDRVGAYGHSRFLHWIGPEDKIIAEVAPGRFLAWQTLSWSDGVKGQDYCTLYQGIHNVPGPSGIQVDVNTIWHDKNWGQIPVPSDNEELSVDRVERLEKKVDFILDQLVGPGRDKNGMPTFSGWKQTNSKTMVDYQNERMDKIEQSLETLASALKDFV